MAQTVELVFVLPRGSLILDWAGPAEAFRIANQEVRRGGPPAPGRVCHALRGAGAERAGISGWIAGLQPLPEQLPEPAWVIVVGRTGTGDEPATRPRRGPSCSGCAASGQGAPACGW
jgi:transcriptional regulator GlxA family with amidase domain